MKKKEFRLLKVDARVRYLADLRGVPKDTIAVVNETGLTDDGEGNRVEGLCRIRISKVPSGFKKMPFMAHSITIFEREAELFEHVAPSTHDS